jgi:hypothetical protein
MRQPIPAYFAGLPFAKRLETAAAMVVASCTGLTLQSLDPGGGSRQLPDFDMLDDQSKSVGALEVTTTTVAERAQFGGGHRSRPRSPPLPRRSGQGCPPAGTGRARPARRPCPPRPGAAERGCAAGRRAHRRPAGACQIFCVSWGSRCPFVILMGSFSVSGQTGTRSPNATANAFMAAFQP